MRLALRLYQWNLDLVFCSRAMHALLGHDEQFASLDGEGQLSFNFHLTLEDVEEIIGRVMLMERVLAEIIRQARSLGGQYIGGMMFFVLPFSE